MEDIPELEAAFSPSGCFYILGKFLLVASERSQMLSPKSRHHCLHFTTAWLLISFRTSCARNEQGNGEVVLFMNWFCYWGYTQQCSSLLLAVLRSLCNLSVIKLGLMVCRAFPSLQSLWPMILNSCLEVLVHHVCHHHQCLGSKGLQWSMAKGKRK